MRKKERKKNPKACTSFAYREKPNIHFICNAVCKWLNIKTICISIYFDDAKESAENFGLTQLQKKSWSFGKISNY